MYKEFDNYVYGLDDGIIMDQYYDDCLHDGIENNYEYKRILNYQK